MASHQGKVVLVDEWSKCCTEHNTDSNYEAMVRWNSKGFKCLIVYAEETLIDTIKTPSPSAGTGKDTIEKWKRAADSGCYDTHCASW